MEPARSSGKRMTMWRQTGRGHGVIGVLVRELREGTRTRGGELSMERSQFCPPRSLSSPRREGDNLSMERLSSAFGQAGWGPVKRARLRKGIRQKNGAARGSECDV